MVLVGRGKMGDCLGGRRIRTVHTQVCVCLRTLQGVVRGLYRLATAYTSLDAALQRFLTGVK